MVARTVVGLMAAVVCLVAAIPLPAEPVGGSGADGSLKWRPHRAAVRAANDAEPVLPEPRPMPAAADAQPAASPLSTANSAPAVGPAPGAAPVIAGGGSVSVTLPPDVPRIVAPVVRGVQGGGNRLPGPVQRSTTAADAFQILPRDLTRAPQGEIGRPVLEPEGRQTIVMQRRRAAADRGDGGLAPAFSASAGPRLQAAGRGERPSGRGDRPAGRDRIAMNVDAMPSVLSRGPQAAAIEGEASRVTPPTGDLPEIVPAPQPATPRISVPDGPALGSPMLGPEIVEGGEPSDDGTGRMLLGQYPAQLHVESFYDDPYEYEDECDSPLHHHYGVMCSWLRQFGKPYYGWRWYRDFTASAGVMSFTNPTDLGINGNYGTNEYLNWAMPFWNAFGVGWQVGARATQSNFQSTSITTAGGTLEKNSRQQVFVTSGFFTRAFEGRGLQGGAVFDYLSDSWFDNADLAQIRGEISYVWGYHEFGFWSANNVRDQIGLFGPVTGQPGQATTVDQYCGFYRLQFGDANEWKVWGGGTGSGSGIVGSLVRAPMSRAFALEGTFTYLIPGKSVKFDADGAGSTYTFSPAAWNVGVNLVYYPAGRSRKSLASPYRPLFDVADNGTMIHTVGPSK